MIQKIKNLTELKQVSMIEASLFFDYAYTYHQFLEIYQNNNYTIYVYLNQTQELVLGYLVINNLIDENEIIKIGVAKSAQNQGIGSKLINFIKTQGKNLILEVSRMNGPAINFYLKHNFKQIALRLGYYKDGSDALIMKWVKNCGE